MHYGIPSQTGKNDWLESKQGFGIVISCPKSRPANLNLVNYFIRCFGHIPYKGDEDRNCISNGICNAFFQILRKKRACELVSNLPASIAAASTRCRPFSEDRAEVADSIKLGSIGSIFQEAGGYLSIKEFTLPPHGLRERPAYRFN